MPAAGISRLCRSRGLANVEEEAMVVARDDEATEGSRNTGVGTLVVRDLIV
jgi:hypothetical protein